MEPLLFGETTMIPENMHQIGRSLSRAELYIMLTRVGRSLSRGELYVMITIVFH